MQKSYDFQPRNIIKEIMRTKDRIVLTSIELFNRQGVVPVTTNHIAKELGISPGNLYFHFANKEEIIRHIFQQVCNDTYKLWRVRPKNRAGHPLELIEKNFELYWRYRFLHREMYFLRRKDQQLSKMWKRHIAKIQKLMTITYRHWIRMGWAEAAQDPKEMNFLVNVMLATASSFLQFFESAEKQAGRKNIELAKNHVVRLLIHHMKGEMRDQFAQHIKID